jgi:hypothetical protein
MRVYAEWAGGRNVEILNMATTRVSDFRLSTRQRLGGFLVAAASGVALLGAAAATPASAARNSAASHPNARHSQHAKRRHHRAVVAGAAHPGASVVAPSGPWPLWGNETIGDCTFATAADWAMITQGKTAVPEAQVIQEFHEAHGSDSEGISTPALASAWSSHGIAGVHAKLTARPASELKSIVRPGTAAVAVLAIPTGQRLVPVRFKLHGHTMTSEPFTIEEGGNHTLVVAGYNPTGPEVVTWGSTIQMTWAQWNEDHPTLYEASCTGGCRTSGS